MSKTEPNSYKIVYNKIVAAERKTKNMGDFGQVAFILLCFVLLPESLKQAK